MQENIKYGILNGLYKIYQDKYPEDDSYIKHFSFPHLILMQEPLSSFLNTSTSESVIKLRHLVKGGYLKEEKVKFYLTEKSLEYLQNKQTSTTPLKEEGNENTKDNFLMRACEHWYVRGVLIGCSVFYIGYRYLTP